MHVSRYGVVLAALATASLAVSGCSAKKNSSIVDKAKNDQKLVIGVKYDQPGLGVKTASGTQGFDVDVAKYIAKKLGVTNEKNIKLKEARSANRETLLQNGTVDLVVATYSITAARKPKVTFGGPYIVTHQDIMTRADDPSIKTVNDLKKKKLCQATGSNSWKNVTEGTNKLNVKGPAKLIPPPGSENAVPQ